MTAVETNVQAVVLTAGRVGTDPDVVPARCLEANGIDQQGQFARLVGEVLAVDELHAVVTPRVGQYLNIGTAAGRLGVAFVAIRRYSRRLRC